MMRNVVLTSSLALSLGLAGCIDELVSEQLFKIRPISASVAFKTLLADPIPDSVTDLQGGGDVYQGYAVSLRFKADPEDIDALVANGYTKTEWYKIESWSELRTEHAHFDPPWAPESIEQKECYELRGVPTAWSHQGNLFLVIDRSSNTVYFFSWGM